MRNLLKSIFISLFPLLAIFFFVDSGIHLFFQDSLIAQIGNIIVSSGVIFFFLNIFINPVARTEAIPKYYTLWIFFGFSISSFTAITNHTLSHSIPAISLAVGWVIYLAWFSVFKNRNNNTILKLNTILPEFKLETTRRDYISSHQFLSAPSIFLFYRGNWCPLCLAQIKEIAAQYKELENRGVNMVFISPQPHKYSKNLAKKYDLGFHFLVDKNNKVATQLGILSKNGIPAGFQALGYDSDTTLPTVVITDEEGKIIYINLTDNYRVRPEPKTFIEALDKHLTA